MKAVILIVSFLLAFYIPTKKSALAQSKSKVVSLVGEWERIDNMEAGNIGKIIFYPDGTLNLINKNRPEMRMLRYRLLPKTELMQGEIISVPFGLGQPKDRIPFTVYFNSPDNMQFTYTAGDINQTIYLKKVKDISHGIIPLSRQDLPSESLSAFAR